MESIINYILGITTVSAQVSSKVGSTVDGVGKETGNQLATLLATFFASIPLWIAAFVVGFLSYVVAVIVKKGIEAKLNREGVTEEHQEVQIVAGRTSFFAVLVLGITIALSIVGIDLKPIVAAGAFGLGFALQDIIMNLISGMMILASRHYTIGDTIQVGSVVGKIVEIQTRATIIKAFDGTKVIVPNAELFKNVVISKTSNPYRKLSFEMGVAYGSDLKQVMKLTLMIVKNIPWVLRKPKPSVIFTQWGDSSIDFRINVWIDSKGGKLIKVKNLVILDLTKAYEEAGINIPYPIQTIEMGKAEEPGLSNQEIKENIKKIKAKIDEDNAKALQAAGPAAIIKSPGEESVGQSWLQQALHKVEQVASNPADILSPLQTAPAQEATQTQPPVQPTSAPAPTPTPASAPTTATVEPIPATMTAAPASTPTPTIIPPAPAAPPSA